MASKPQLDMEQAKEAAQRVVGDVATVVHGALCYIGDRNSRTRYLHKLLRKWLPALPQVVEALNAGGIAADVGCGGGRAAIMIAQAFPKAHVVGYDLHAESIERARRNAQTAGVADRV